MQKVLKTKNTDEVENDEEESAEEQTLLKEELSPFWSFCLPNQKFYIILWKTPNCTYNCRLLDDFNVEIKMTCYPTKDDLKFASRSTGVDIEMLAPFYQEKVFTRIIQAPSPLLPAAEKFTSEDDMVAIFSFPLKHCESLIL